jgi:hypothetical protein
MSRAIECGLVSGRAVPRHRVAASDGLAGATSASNSAGGR